MKYVDLCKKTSGSISTIRNESARSSAGIIKIVAFFIIIGLVAGVIFFKDKVGSAFNPISVIATVAKPNLNLKETDDRTNVLVLGSDQRIFGTESGHTLTDTILVASIGKDSGDIVMISIPRDLWVKGTSSKINAVYAFSNMANKDGAQELGNAVQEVLGIPIHYHVLVSFQMFEDAVDVLGGVDVNVENPFEDYVYPIEGKEADLCGKTQEEVTKAATEAGGDCPVSVCSCRYKHLIFRAGVQHMDGATALEFARSRHGTNNEGNDFARARRQQKIISAVKDKVMSLEILANPLKLKELYDTYSKNTDTDIDLSTAQSFYLLTQRVGFENIVSIVLSDEDDASTGGLLFHPSDSSLYGGQYVLIPKAGDYSQIHAFVQKYLFGEKN